VGFDDGIVGPVTREKVEALAREMADDQSSVAEFRHEGFDADAANGGFAFVLDAGLLLYSYRGARGITLDPGDDVGRAAAVDDFWRQSRHRNRPLALGDVSPWHRAAIAALVARADSVADLPASAREGVDDVARADDLLVRLRRYAEPTTEAALAALAAHDHILAAPHETQRAHPCPVCGRPAIGVAWGVPGVCDDCHGKAECLEGRPVIGFNVTPLGGFIARHREDRSTCDQVTRDGRVRIGSTAAHMGEAKFGGVYAVVGDFA